jgi:hypothetical protein
MDVGVLCWWFFKILNSAGSCLTRPGPQHPPRRQRWHVLSAGAHGRRVRHWHPEVLPRLYCIYNINGSLEIDATSHSRGSGSRPERPVPRPSAPAPKFLTLGHCGRYVVFQAMDQGQVGVVRVGLPGPGLGYFFLTAIQ